MNVLGFEGIAISRFFLETISYIFVVINFCPKVAFTVIFGKRVYFHVSSAVFSRE